MSWRTCWSWWETWIESRSWRGIVFNCSWVWNQFEVRRVSFEPTIFVVTILNLCVFPPGRALLFTTYPEVSSIASVRNYLGGFEIVLRGVACHFPSISWKRHGPRLLHLLGAHCFNVLHGRNLSPNGHSSHQWSLSGCCMNWRPLSKVIVHDKLAVDFGYFSVLVQFVVFFLLLE